MHFFYLLQPFLGATLVTALSTLPNANKLFARAWSTSGGAVYPRKHLSEAELENLSYLHSIQCKDAECLREKDPISLLNAVEDTWRKPQPDLPMKDAPEKKHEWLVLDGTILKEPLDDIWLSQRQLSVKLVIGTTAHVCASEKLLSKYINWTEDLVRNHVKKSNLSELKLAEDALNAYPNTYKGLTSLISDLRIVCPLYDMWKKMTKVPFYIVVQTRGKLDLANANSDVDAILGRYEPKTPEQRRYLSTMQQLFYHYVWHGEITHMEVSGRKVLVVGQDNLPASNYSFCDFWIKKNVVPLYAQLD